MAKLQDCQFIKINIDGKDVAGSSEEDKYKGWMEGYSPAGLMTHSGSDGTYFESGRFSVLVTKETSTLYEKYLARGYKSIKITIVHRGSDAINKDYEIQNCVYNDCKFKSLYFEMSGAELFMHVSFDYQGSVTIIFNVPNANGDALDKIGPIEYDIPSKSIK